MQEFYKLWFWFGSGTGVEFDASKTGTDFLNCGFSTFLLKCSAISGLGSRPRAFLVAEILGPELG